MGDGVAASTGAAGGALAIGASVQQTRSRGGGLLARREATDTRAQQQQRNVAKSWRGVVVRIARLQPTEVHRL